MTTRTITEAQLAVIRIREGFHALSRGPGKGPEPWTLSEIDDYLDSIFAALPHEPDTGLDVERLKRALIESDLIVRYTEYARLSPRMDPNETVEHTAALWASEVARAYARLDGTLTDSVYPECSEGPEEVVYDSGLISETGGTA